MKKMNKEEILSHIRDIDKESAKIYNVLAGGEKISSYKLTLYTNQLIQLSEESIHSVTLLDKTMRDERKKYILFSMIFIFLSSLALFSYIISFPVGFTLNSISLITNAFLLKKMKKEQSINKNIEEETSALFPKLQHTLSNCSMFLARHCDTNESELKTNNFGENFAHYILSELIEGAKLVDISDDLRIMLINILQQELNVNENDLNVLLDLAKKEVKEEPFKENTNEVLKLSRKKNKERG